MDYLKFIEYFCLVIFLTLPWGLFFAERRLRKNDQREFVRLFQDRFQKDFEHEKYNDE